jgi:single-stranded-DNA-specific exonuclease
MKEYVEKKISSQQSLMGHGRVESAILEENGITSNDKMNEYFPDLFGKKSWLTKFISEEMSPVGNWEAFVSFIREHKSESFCVIGDYDADGVMATTIMKLALLTFGVSSVHHVIPDRLNDGYGIRDKHVDRAIELGAKVIITVDNGITANSTIDYAKSKGLYVLVTDHHIPEMNNLPRADVLVNPHLTAATEKMENICGAFVAFKLATKMLDIKNRDHEFIIKDMALFASVATVSDVMPMFGENRLLLKYTLDNVNFVKNRGIWGGRTLKFLSGFGVRRAIKDGDALINEDTFGFLVGPTINASGRVNGETEGIVDDIINSVEYGNFIDGYSEINRERQTKTKEIFKEHKISDDPIGFMVIDHSKYSYPIGGLIGLVANRVADIEQKPAFIGTKKDGKISFSCRSVPGYSLHEGLTRFHEKYPDSTVEGGGHNGAIGIRTSSEVEVNLLKEHFIEDFKKYSGIERQNVYVFERDFMDEIFAAHRTFSPFGQMFQKLKFTHTGIVRDISAEEYLIQIDDIWFKTYIKKEDLPKVGETTKIIFSVSQDSSKFDDFKIDKIDSL